MIVGERDAVEKLKHDTSSFMVVTQLDVMDTMSKEGIQKEIFPILVFLLFLGLAFSELASTSRLATAMVMLLALTGAVDSNSMLKAIDAPVLMTVACMIGFSHSIIESGLSDIIVNAIVSMDAHPWAVYALVTAVTSCMTELVTNNSAAVISFSIVSQLVTRLGVNPTPFLIGLMVSSSSSFANPIGYSTNIMAYASASYKCTDFVRFGLALDVLFFATHVALVPVIWPF